MALCLVEYHTLARWSFLAYWGTILMLAAVPVFGTMRGGARRWFKILGFSF